MNMSFFAQSVFLTALASLALSAFAYFKGREKEINCSLALFSLALAVWMFAQGMGAVAAQKEAILIWMRLQVGAAVFLPPFFLYFIFTLLEINQRMKGVLRASYLTALLFILLDLTPLFVDRIRLFQGIKYYPELTAVYAAFALWLIVSFCFGLTLLVMALRKSTGKQYNKLLYVFIASLVGFLGGGTAFFPIFNIKLPVISHMAMPLYVGVATYAIVKHKLLDITVYVRKGMIYSLVTASFTAIYVVLLLAANNFFQGWGQYNSLIATVFIVFGMGLIFQPLRDRSQAIIDHLFFKSQYDYQETIKNFSEQLSSALRLEELNLLVRDGLLRILKAREAEICFGDRAPAGGSVLTIPVESKGKKWGSVVLGPKLSGDDYSAEDIRLLTTLANQMAVAFENIQLYQQLVRSESLAALGMLAAGMAHEIKNPLASIKAMTQVMPENIEDKEFISKYVEMIPRQLDRINSTVENLLKAGRAPKLERKSVNVNVVLHEVLDLHLNLCRKQGVEIARYLGDLPPIFADPDQLQQVFVNLVLNAMQAMPEGGRLEVGGRVQDEQVIIQISDTGMGIPPDKLDKIFNPFFTLKEKGSGLGLFTAFRIVQEHGGTIDVKSQEGEGSSFTIRLAAHENVQ
jgi:signal transduction histidine kinase